MNIINNFTDIITKHYVDFEGRASRSEFWYFVLVNVLLGWVVGILAVAIGIPGLAYIYSLALMLPGLAVGVRRLHDTGKSGWWLLLALTGIGGIVVIAFYCMDSEPGTNKYGPNPKGVTASYGAYPQPQTSRPVQTQAPRPAQPQTSRPVQVQAPRPVQPVQQVQQVPPQPVQQVRQVPPQPQASSQFVSTSMHASEASSGFVSASSHQPAPSAPAPALERRAQASAQGTVPRTLVPVDAFDEDDEEMTIAEY